MTIERGVEAEAFLATIERTARGAVSACDGWTTHEIAAHVTGIAVEVVRHLDPYLQGDPVPKTRSFEEREAPLQDLDHDVLLKRLDDAETHMRAVVGQVLDGDPDATIPWTGREMRVEKFVPHLRNEHALHRWDIAGDDETSNQILGRPELVEHSVGELGEILLRAGRKHDPDPDSDFGVRLHTSGEPDLAVAVSSGTARLVWADDVAPDDVAPDDETGPVVRLDAPARHLFIWGRRPDTRGRIRSDLAAGQLDRLQKLLSGY